MKAGLGVKIQLGTLSWDGGDDSSRHQTPRREAQPDRVKWACDLQLPGGKRSCTGHRCSRKRVTSKGLRESSTAFQNLASSGSADETPKTGRTGWVERRDLQRPGAWGPQEGGREHDHFPRPPALPTLTNHTGECASLVSNCKNTNNKSFRYSRSSEWNLFLKTRPDLLAGKAPATLRKAPEPKTPLPRVMFSVPAQWLKAGIDASHPVASTALP